jgi:hypothetical protein
MAARPGVRDIQAYLRDNGWEHSLTWRGAPVWSRADGYEVLVPPRDDLADIELRVSELLNVLATAERRPVGEVVVDINAPLDDIQSFRTASEGMPPGYTSLEAGIRGLRAVRSLLSVAARTVIEGPQPEFGGRIPPAASELLHRVRLGLGRPGSYIFTVRVPVGLAAPPADALDDAPHTQPEEPLGRQVARQVHEAVTAASAATARATREDPSAFDEALTAGVSANLCLALSMLAGSQHEQAFDITFRWSPRPPAALPADTIHFADGAGQIIRAATRRLRQVRVSGTAEVTGFVESLHDRPESADRWRVKVRGDLAMRDSVAFGRTIWVRLDGEASYDRAIVAHQSRHLVLVRGDLSVHGRVELVTDSTRFEVIG